MLKYMLCGAVVMTASCVGMEKKSPTYDQSSTDVPIGRIVCHWCPNPQCLGPLPGFRAHCMRVGALTLIAHHDQGRNNGWIHVSRNASSHNSFEGT